MAVCAVVESEPDRGDVLEEGRKINSLFVCFLLRTAERYPISILWMGNRVLTTHTGAHNEKPTLRSFLQQRTDHFCDH